MRFASERARVADERLSTWNSSQARSDDKNPSGLVDYLAEPFVVPCTASPMMSHLQISAIQSTSTSKGPAKVGTCRNIRAGPSSGKWRAKTKLNRS